jgi:hypothetical protein
MGEACVALPEMKGKYTDARLFFRDLISRRKTTALLAKYAYDVLETFYAALMLKINRDFIIALFISLCF